jgi:hypothetical protein
MKIHVNQSVDARQRADLSCAHYNELCGEATAGLSE